jgi:large subunit ribosomal protein L16
MPMMPKRVKFRKSQRGKIKGNATRGNTVAFGEFGLQSLEAAWISAREIEAGRVAVSHYLRREGRLHIRIFPHKPISAKPLEVRMGSGKGEPEFWAAVVKPGTVMFEVAGVDEATAKRALARVAHKMSVRTRFVKRKHAVA